MRPASARRFMTDYPLNLIDFSRPFAPLGGLRERGAEGDGEREAAAWEVSNNFQEKKSQWQLHKSAIKYRATIRKEFL